MTKINELTTTMPTKEKSLNRKKMFLVKNNTNQASLNTAAGRKHKKKSSLMAEELWMFEAE